MLLKMIFYSWAAFMWLYLCVVCFYYAWVTPHPNDYPFCAAALYFGDQAYEALGHLIEELQK